MGMGEEILVVKTDKLFEKDWFLGFVPSDKYDFLNTIIENAEYRVRTEELENDTSLQQPIPYVWIVNPENKTVFLYKRAKTGNEGRLHNLYSGGVGGHIDKNTEEGEADPIHAAMMRELKEEVAIEEYPEPKVVGFLNLEHEVHGVHFAVVALAETTLDVKPVEDMDSGKFYSIDEVEELSKSDDSSFEEWTSFSWPFIKNYLNKL